MFEGSHRTIAAASTALATRTLANTLLSLSERTLEQPTVLELLDKIQAVTLSSIVMGQSDESEDSLGDALSKNLPVVYCCENDHAEVRTPASQIEPRSPSPRRQVAHLSELVAGRAIVVDCMVDRVSMR